MKPMKIGVLGAGSFGNCFIPLFKAHPLVSEVCIAEKMPDRRNKTVEKHGLREAYESLDELCESSVDAIAIFSQRWKHGPQAVQALNAGKHVYSAVPAAITLEELDALVKAVERTGLTYAMGETSYYYPEAVYCRNKFRKGAFGRVVYAEAEYYHDMEHGFYGPYQGSNGEEWKRFASFPPMLYPSHSVGFVLSITGSHMTHVSCLGLTDDHEDGIFREDVSHWGNAFSNESALMQAADGTMCRINEFRRTAASGVRLRLYGTRACFEEQTGAKSWTTHDRTTEDVTGLLKCRPLEKPEDWEAARKQGAQEDFYSGLAPVHDGTRLPAEFNGLKNGHNGSHQFLVDDFVQAVAEGTTPPVNVWTAARYCAPGIVAHESAKKDGERLAIPDFGEPRGARGVAH